MRSAQALGVRLLRALWLTASWPFRVLWSWIYDAFHCAASRTGYRVIVPAAVALIGAYVGLYAVMEAGHEHKLHRATIERWAFIDLVTSNHRSAFVTAMQGFGTVQMMAVPPRPAILPPWRFLDWWGKPTQPNMLALYMWTQDVLPQCTPQLCGQPDRTEPSNPGKGVRIDLIGADLRGAFLRGAGLDDVKHDTPSQSPFFPYWSDKTMWPDGFTPPCPQNTD